MVLLRRVVVFSLLWAASSQAAEKPAISWKAPPAAEDDRPVATAIIVGPQGSDYAFQIDFNREPWGEGCGNRCANTTIFLDTDNIKATGLQLKDPKAPETGADLAVIIQGQKEYKEGSSSPVLRVKVKQFPEGATTIDQSTELVDMDLRSDPERVNASEKTVWLLIDANIGDLPAGKQLRVVYHPPESKGLVGMAKGLSAAGASRVEIFKEGRLTNPKKKKPAFE